MTRGMGKVAIPVTTAVRELRRHNVAFTPHFYKYEERGGTAVSSRELGVDEHCVVKTLIMEDDAGEPLVVLMHGDAQVSVKQLARLLGVKSIAACAPEVANRHSGYVVGGTSPFGTRKRMPVFVEASILELRTVYVNGGKQGFLVALDPRVFVQVLGAQPVTVAVP